MDDDVVLDKFYWHEALDRAHLAQDFFYEYVATHPVIEQNIALKEKADTVMAHLMDMYQSIIPEQESQG